MANKKDLTSVSVCLVSLVRPCTKHDILLNSLRLQPEQVTQLALAHCSTNTTMDVSHLDDATATVVVELRLTDISEALANVNLGSDKRATFSILSTTLRLQLMTLIGEVRKMIWSTDISHTELCLLD
jgi:hypothetical protein